MNKDELKEIVESQIEIGADLLKLITRNNTVPLARNISFIRGYTIKPDSLQKEVQRDHNFLTRFLPFWAGYLKTDFGAGQRLFAFLSHFYASFAFEPRDRAGGDRLFIEANEAWARVQSAYIRRDFEQYKLEVITFLAKVLAIGGTDPMNRDFITESELSINTTPLGKAVKIRS